MQVILIGSGNVAGLMGTLLIENGHQVQQVFSRTLRHAEKLADKLHAEAIASLAHVKTGADIYIVSVADDALPDIAAGLRLTHELVVHTSGTASASVLGHCSSHTGVLWPVKMVRQSTTSFSGAAMVIDGIGPGTIDRIRELASIFSSHIRVADDSSRAQMHMIAAFTANFSNHLYDLAATYCEKHHISFEMFYPLIQAAVEQLPSQHPHQLQAGPAFRGDKETIRKHRVWLQNEPQMSKIYDMMTESIQNSFGLEPGGK